MNVLDDTVETARDLNSSFVALHFADLAELGDVVTLLDKPLRYNRGKKWALTFRVASGKEEKYTQELRVYALRRG
jgi:hypothetical protein